MGYEAQAWDMRLRLMGWALAIPMPRWVVPLPHYPGYTTHRPTYLSMQRAPATGPCSTVRPFCQNGGYWITNLPSVILGAVTYPRIRHTVPAAPHAPLHVSASVNLYRSALLINLR